MDLDLNVCKLVSSKHGLPLQFTIKEFHVMEALNLITVNNQVSKDIVFKGGTALNKVYFEKMQRFSEDLDFDFETDSIKGLWNKCREIAEIFENSYEVKEFRRVRDTIQFYCIYETGLDKKDHIRIDVAKKDIITSKPLVIKAAVSEFTQRTVSGFKIYDIDDLTARKLNALCYRTEGKDMYDSFYAIPMCKNLKAAIAKSLESEGKKITVQEFINETVNSLKTINARQKKYTANSFIPTQYRPKDWNMLRNDLVLKMQNLQANF